MSTLTLRNGTVITRVSRASCLARVDAIALGSFAYSQARIETSTGKRADCTGWVSYVWDTPDSGPGIYLNAYNTASFYTQHVITRIPWSDLLPGDMIGYCSPTSPGNGGHAAIWMGGDRRPDGVFDVSDHGSGWGPKRRHVSWDGSSTGWLHPDHLAPWRYVGTIEGEDEDMMTPEQFADLLIKTKLPNGMGVANALTTLVARVPWDTVTRLNAILAAAQDDGNTTVVASPEMLAELVAVRDALGTLPTEAVVRDAIADFAEGGAAAVRADTE